MPGELLFFRSLQMQGMKSRPIIHKTKQRALDLNFNPEYYIQAYPVPDLAVIGAEPGLQTLAAITPGLVFTLVAAAAHSRRSYRPARWYEQFSVPEPLRLELMLR